jgi:hypothetical protein
MGGYGAMQIDLTDEEAVALLALLDRAIENDRFLLSLRARTLYGIRPKLLVRGPHRLQPDRRVWDGRAVSCVCRA